MKKTITLISIFYIFSALVYAQSFEEITEFGWGRGTRISRPNSADIDNDGLLDVLIGEYYGTLCHYEQESSSLNNFVLVTNSFSGIDVGYLSASCFADIDNDGLLDMIVGEYDGNLNHYEQESSGSYNFVLVTNSFNEIDVGYSSVPTLTDIDDDGLLDLIVGETDGNLNHFEQESSGSYNFVLITDSFNGINDGDYSVPNFTDIDDDNLLDMFIGEVDGCINHYEQESIGSYNFVLITHFFNSSNFFYGRVGNYSASFFVDIDNDGLLDMLIGNYDGNLSQCEQEYSGSINFPYITKNFYEINVGACSAPCVVDIDNDGLFDMLIGEYDGYLNHYEQESTGSFNFLLVTDSFNGIDIGEYSNPCFVDIDNDGLFDMLIGELDGNLNHYEQESSDSYNFVLITNNFNGINTIFTPRPCFADIDNDGLMDIIVGGAYGTLYHYEQESSDSYNFVLITENFNGIDVGFDAAPIFTDGDEDGLLDLIIGENNGNLNHYEQESPESYNFVLITENYYGIYVGGMSTPFFEDINSDGLMDLLIGEWDGGIHLCKQIIIPDFTANPRFGYTSQDVSFSNLTIGNPTNIFWDFENDGIYDSSDLNPTHNYTQPGVYCVKLKIEKSAFQDSLIKTNYIIVQVQELTEPQNIMINIDNNNIILQWDSVTNAGYYLIYKSTNSYGVFEFLDYTTGNSNTIFTHTGVTLDEEKMFYFVIGFDGTLRELHEFIDNNQTKEFENLLK